MLSLSGDPNKLIMFSKIFIGFATLSNKVHLLKCLCIENKKVSLTNFSENENNDCTKKKKSYETLSITQ